MDPGPSSPLLILPQPSRDKGARSRTARRSLSFLDSIHGIHSSTHSSTHQSMALKFNVHHRSELNKITSLLTICYSACLKLPRVLWRHIHLAFGIGASAVPDRSVGDPNGLLVTLSHGPIGGSRVLGPKRGTQRVELLRCAPRPSQQESAAFGECGSRWAAGENRYGCRRSGGSATGRLVSLTIFDVYVVLALGENVQLGRRNVLMEPLLRQPK